MDISGGSLNRWNISSFVGRRDRFCDLVDGSLVAVGAVVVEESSNRVFLVLEYCGIGEEAFELKPDLVVICFDCHIPPQISTINTEHCLTHRNELFRSMSRRVQDYFEMVSPQWDVMRKSFYGEEVRDAVLNSVGINPTDTVLDVGAGTGFLTEAAAKLASKVIALDLSKGMSDEAIAKIGGGNVEFRIGNAERMPLQDASVNVVIGNMVLHHCPHPRIAISEMFRVLKSDGRIAISDLQEHPHEWLRKEHADLWLGFKMEEVESMMTEVGLGQVRVETLSSCCSSLEDGQQVKIPMFLASGKKTS